MKPFLQCAALVVLAIVLAGCDKDKTFRLAFSHNLHVTDNGMACSDCHGKMTDGRFSAAGHAACKDCHGDWIDAKEIGAKTCGMCHKAKDLKALPKLEYAPAASNAVIEVGGVFRHSAALSNRCADCHGALLDKKTTLIPEFTHDEKVRIRERAHRWGLSCAVCHENMDRTTPPPSHSQNWTRRHGLLGTQPDAACAVCHNKESCRNCHQVTKPASHNNLWRLQTHGTQAAWDRKRCEVCHQEDSCTACHADTRPQSHNAGWRQNHCFNCHPSKSTGTGCTVCHKTDIESHPNPHGAGWLEQHCDTCHQATIAVGQCGVCHKGLSDLRNHPDPHPAGWTQTHCNTCHLGTPHSGQCDVCHAGGLAGHPDPHPAGWRDAHCNNCHSGAPDAQQCAICHGFSTLAGHPNPHAVGWQTSHCFSCHPGAAAAQCAICHAGGSSLLVHQGNWPSFHDRFAGTANVNLCYNCHTP